MVHFPGFARARLWIHRAVRGVYPRGFPHSEIFGSKPACGSPKLIAACHVLLRLLLPRHPPCALSSLTTKFTRHTDFIASIASTLSSRAEHQFRDSGIDAQSRDPVLALDLCKFANTPIQSHGPLSRSTDPDLKADALNSVSSQRETISGTHKNYVRLVNCPIYSVVKYRPRGLSST
jgi:hypothetical protein